MIKFNTFVKMKTLKLIIIFLAISVGAFSQVLMPDYIQNYDSDKPIVYAVDLGGGYQQVADSTAKADLPSDKRVIGMMVSYKDNGFWVTERYEGTDVLNTNWRNDVNWNRLVITDTLTYYATQTALEDTAAAITSRINLPALGTDGQVPYMNVGGTDFLYSDDFLKTATGLAINGTFISQFNTDDYLEATQDYFMYYKEWNTAQEQFTFKTDTSRFQINSSSDFGGVNSTFFMDMDRYDAAGNEILYTIGGFEKFKVTNDTTFMNSHLKVDSNLYVGGILIDPSGINYGTQGDIPFTNAGLNDFDYESTGSLNWDGNILELVAGIGFNNVLIGDNTGTGMTGNTSTHIGSGAGRNTVDGVANIFIGYNTGNFNVSGDFNTYIGRNSGYNATGSSNVFLGFQSGYNETGSNKLYIENSNSSTPLIYGDFANDSLNINGQFNVDSIKLYPTSRASHAEGMLNYDTESKSLVFQNDISNFNHNIGYEHVVRVYNMTGSQIDNGRLVRIDSVKINGFITPSVQLAGIYSLDSISGVGMATVDIPNESYGIVTLFGEVKGLNTSAYNNADALYADTAGYIRNTKPDPPAYTLRIGYVEYADNDSGQVYMLPGEIGFSQAPNFSADTTRLSLAVTIITQNVFEYVPLSGAVVRKNFGYTVQGDSVQASLEGDYDIDLGMSFQGNPASETWRYGIFVNNVEQHTKTRTTSGSGNGDVDVSKEARLSVGDWVSFRIANESGAGDPTMVDMSFELKWLNE